MLIAFDLVKHQRGSVEKGKIPESRILYLNPVYIVSVAQDVSVSITYDRCHLTMASRGDPEEGNDYYTVLGKAADLKNRINHSHAQLVS